MNMSKLRDTKEALKLTWHILRTELPAAIHNYLDDLEEKLDAQAQGCICAWYREPGGPQHRVMFEWCPVYGHTWIRN